MSDENPEIRLPEDDEEVINMADAETENQENLAVAQAELIGDL